MFQGEMSLSRNRLMRPGTATSYWFGLIQRDGFQVGRHLNALGELLRTVKLPSLTNLTFKIHSSPKFEGFNMPNPYSEHRSVDKFAVKWERFLENHGRQLKVLEVDYLPLWA